MSQTISIRSDERFASCLPYVGERLARSKIDVKLAPLECLIERRTKALQEHLISALSEVIVVDCKAHFIESNLKLPIQNKLHKHAFIRALCEFDYETDKMIASALLQLGDEFLLHSFYDFCTDKLKTRWQEAITLANDNLPHLLCGQNFCELLRFLVSTIENRTHEAFIVKRGACVEVLDRNMRPFEGVYVNLTLPEDIRIIETLVALSPRKIFNLTGSKDLQETIETIFGNCEEKASTMLS